MMPTYRPQSSEHEVPIQWDSAQGWLVYSQGRAYLDFTSGIFVANIGHSHSLVIQAIKEQLDKPLLHSYAFSNEARYKLEEKLCQMTGYQKVFLCSTGAEAVEAFIRVVSSRKDGLIVASPLANHGRTAGARSLVSDTPRSYQLNYDNHPAPWMATRTVAVIFESYFGWNAQFHPVEWVKEWCRWAQAYRIPICFDEIQAGFGRTGKLFGFEHYGVRPDLICVGKALGGGLPISALLGSASLLDNATDLSSTHTGNPVCCAAALATLGVLEEQHLIERAASMELIFQQELASITYPVNGRGMVWAIDLQDKDKANQIVDRCAELGLLLVKTHRGTIKLGPPLTIPRSEVQKGIAILRQAITECA